MKKRNYILLSAVPVLSALAFSTGAFAQTVTPTPTAGTSTHQFGSMKNRGPGRMGMHKGMHNTGDAASILGMTEADLTAQLSTGKTLDAIILEKGLTKVAFDEKMKTLHETEMKTKLASLVTSGKITQAEMDKMVADRATHEATMKATMAKALGITVAELDAYKASGTSIDTIITQKGLDKATVMKAFGEHRGEHEGISNKHGNKKGNGFLKTLKDTIKTTTQ